MAKIDKSLYSKSEWKKIREQRRQSKKIKPPPTPIVQTETVQKPCASTGFVLGNGVSRQNIDLNLLKKYGTVYGCNALYREFAPDYLVAVDVKMILEISKTGYHNQHPVWTNPNKSFAKISNLNYFQPSKGWSSGPTALHLACSHKLETIFILGFDYQGLEDGKKVNNIYADTKNYKKSHDGATYYGNWLKQTKKIIQDNSTVQFTRVIASDNYCPEELNRFDNFKTIRREDFEKIFDLK